MKLEELPEYISVSAGIMKFEKVLEFLNTPADSSVSLQHEDLFRKIVKPKVYPGSKRRKL